MAMCEDSHDALLSWSIAPAGPGAATWEALMAAIHHDKSFGHALHIVLMIVTLGVWIPVWLARWQMHKTDRVREALTDIDQQLDKLVSG